MAKGFVEVTFRYPGWMMPLLKAYCLLLWVGLQIGATTADRMNEREERAIHYLVRRTIRVVDQRIVGH